MKKTKNTVHLVSEFYIEQWFRQKNSTPWTRENKKVTSQNSWFLKGLPTDFVMSLSYFSSVQEAGIFLSEPLFDVEFTDKKNCIFSFFHIFKIRGAIRKTANYQLLPDQLLVSWESQDMQIITSILWSLRLDTERTKTCPNRSEIGLKLSKMLIKSNHNFLQEISTYLGTGCNPVPAIICISIASRLTNPKKEGTNLDY